MPSKYIYTEIDGTRIKLSNLEKVLYPEAGITKAEIIEYFLTIAPHLLRHSHFRPLTLVRTPDGVTSKRFFARNKPSWTPNWMPTLQLPWDEENIYLTIKEKVHLIWLANLAAMEIHSMNVRSNAPTLPDHFVIDLDPDEFFSFDHLKEICLIIKDYTESYGYKPFIKTSGGKGFHISVPIIPKWTHEELMETLKKMFKDFVNKYPKTTTLAVHKDKRRGKVLIDILRNHRGNTTVVPYTLRAKPGAPVSMPFDWEKLESIQSAADYHLINVIQYLKENEDPWLEFDKYAVPLHDRRNIHAVEEPQLKSYVEKRNFEKTTEPIAETDTSINGKYIVHLHDASNLHYDLRLGVNGVLRSWAVPKCIPLKSGKKRLAIQTEDHPAKYIDFEGSIPKEEYGGGEMWIFDKGDFQFFKNEKKKIEIQLNGQLFTGSLRLIHTKGQQWFVEALDETINNIEVSAFKHMLAESRKTIPDSASHFFEIKWDGIRAFIIKDQGKIEIMSRGGRSLTKQFPELCDIDKIDAETAVLDAEIVCLDKQGKPQFSDVISRMHSIGEANIRQLIQAKPAYCYFFDFLFLDGHDITKLPIEKRQAWMNAIVKSGNLFRISEVFKNGHELYKAAETMGLEGIMAKRKGSKYSIGKRTNAWEKIKFRKTMDVKVIGYTEGKGDRSPYFGSLHVVEKNKEDWIYRGRVGTGFNESKLKEIKDILAGQMQIKKPISDPVEEEKRTVWISPGFMIELKYASLSSNDTLREPVFIQLRPDLNP